MPDGFFLSRKVNEGTEGSHDFRENLQFLVLRGYSTVLIIHLIDRVCLLKDLAGIKEKEEQGGSATDLSDTFMNPLIWKKGVCDPHIHIFEGKAYLYATHDAPGYEDGFHMDDWQIWSSENLIDWTLEAVVDPADFYCGPLNQCWAVDAACRDGKYYLYYSTGDWGVGVAVSHHPAGPFTDVLGKALVDYRVHPEGVPKWDPCVFVDDDKSAYLIAGTCKYDAPWDCYLIARLEEDMIHLAEPLRRVEYLGNPWPEDKPSVHKYNGRYYLTHSSYFAVSDQVYGPYRYMGNTGCNIDHGSYFSYHNQTYFASGGMDNPNRYFRASFLTPCHYRQNGCIEVDQKIMSYGCGQYDAVWEIIEAVWYFASSRECKKENCEGGFDAQLRKGEYLYFPNIANVEEDSMIHFKAGGEEDTAIAVHEDSPDGPLLGRCAIGKMMGMYSDRLKCRPGKKSLYLVAEEAVCVRWFSFAGGKKRYTLEPVFSSVGRGASIAYDPDASNHQILQNMELRGAAMEANADGGAGGEGRLVIPYFCTGAETKLSAFVNQELQGQISFPVTPKPCLGKLPCVREHTVWLNPGLNRIRLCSQEYQEGRLAIDHITVESRETNCRAYAAADGRLEPQGNGCWDGFPQRESDPEAFSGRVVKFLEKPGDRISIDSVDGGAGGNYLLEIHYSRGEEGLSSYRLFINNRKCADLQMEFTGGFSCRCMKVCQVKIWLDEGVNSLVFEKNGKKDKGIFVDAFTVIQLQ